MNSSNSRVRLSVVGAIIISLFSILFVRLWFLQVVSPETYAAATKANRIRVISEPAIRGNILDRNGKVIVKSELVNSVQVRRGITEEERKVMVPNLAKAIGKTKEYVNSRLDSVKFSPYQPVPIITNVPYDTMVYIKERPEDFPRVDVVRRSIRVYPDGSIAPHLLGYVAAINKQDQKLFPNAKYGPEENIGKDGVERMFETELRGVPRERKFEVDSRGRLIRVLKDRPAVVGNDVQLTVDLDVQRVTQESLEQGMRAAGGLKNTGEKRRYENFKATGGAAIVIDARDGSVIALASAPAFDVTRFTDGIPIEEYAKIKDPASNFPLLNRVTQGQYAPASTWKLFTSIAALETGVVTPEEVIYDRGFVEFGNPPQRFNNAQKQPHGVVTLSKALTVSSDVYYYTMGFRFWKFFSNRNANPENLAKGYAIQNVAKRFGFGKPTGIGLSNEASGRIPDESIKIQYNQNSPDPFAKEWLPGDSANLAVGQGDLLVTPLQEAIAYGAFANGGTIYSPRLAKAILSPGGAKILRELPIEKRGQVKLSAAIRDAILPGLIGASLPNGSGTASAAFSGYQGMEVAGKTGTAQVNNKQDTSVYAAIVNPNPPPDTDQPQYVVVVFVEQGGFGGSVAAPIARRIIEALNGNPNPASVRLVSQRDD